MLGGLMRDAALPRPPSCVPSYRSRIVPRSVTEAQSPAVSVRSFHCCEMRRRLDKEEEEGMNSFSLLEFCGGGPMTMTTSPLRFAGALVELSNHWSLILAPLHLASYTPAAVFTEPPLSPPPSTTMASGGGGRPPPSTPPSPFKEGKELWSITRKLEGRGSEGKEALDSLHDNALMYMRSCFNTAKRRYV